MIIRDGTRIYVDLMVYLLGSQDSIAFKRWFRESSPVRYIHGFQAGRDFLGYAEVDRLVSAMAAFDLSEVQTAYGMTAAQLSETLQIAMNSPLKVV